MVGDSLGEGLPSPQAWGNIIAMPTTPGSLLCFSHVRLKPSARSALTRACVRAQRLLHWGSKASPGAPPRIAMSFALADPSFEAPFFDCKLFLPYPPHALRLALRAGQAIAYNAQAPLDKAQLALDTRVFHAGRHFFNDDYVDKISSAAQFIKFMMKTGGGRKR
jgi:hypothetical protein